MKRSRKVQSLLSPRKIPVVRRPQWLQFTRWVIDPVGYMLDCWKFGADCFAAGISGSRSQPIIFVQDPQILHYLFTHDRKELYAPGDAIAVLEPLIGKSSVVMLEGERHLRRRRLMLPPFHGERLHVYADLIASIALEEVAKQPQHSPFRAHRLTQQISLQVIMQSVFGLERGPRFEETRRLLTEVFDTFSSPFASMFLYFKSLQRNWGPWRSFLRRRQQMDTIIHEEISARATEQRSDRTDVLALLMAAKDDCGEGMTPQELRDELVTLLLAGLETTSTVMAWALYWIHREPEVKRRLLEELALLPAGAKAADMARLPYLTAVCNEVLRIHPPVPFTFSRIVREDMEIMGWEFPKGSRVAGCIYLLHQREDLYPRPDEFRPERFLERKFSISEFMPFGAGARRCVGEALSMLEIKVAIATLLSAYEFALADERREKPVRRGVILTPSRGVPIRIVGLRDAAQGGQSLGKGADNVDFLPG